MTSTKSRAELTEKLLDIKRENGWTWKYICGEIGGMSPVLITGAILGQMKLTKPQAVEGRRVVRLEQERAGAAQRGTTPRLSRCRRPIR